MNWTAVAVFAVIYLAFLGVYFATRLNRADAVETGRVVDGEITAINFYWRPG